MTDAIVAHARQTIRDTTAIATEYDLDELDDLGSRKQEVPISGDDLARIIRARRGTARATGQVDPYFTAYVAERNVWGFVADRADRWDGNRRMAAVGGTAAREDDAPGALVMIDAAENTYIF